MVKDNQYFVCRIYKIGSLKLRSMGIEAVRSHMKPIQLGYKIRFMKAFNL